MAAAILPDLAARARSVLAPCFHERYFPSCNLLWREGDTRTRACPPPRIACRLGGALAFAPARLQNIFELGWRLHNEIILGRHKEA
jgi:hypothetical protein